jgi:E3 ubiquitin-protein ligase HERC2
MKTRFNENKEQIEAMREGLKLVFTSELIPVLQLMDWEQIESRACGEKTVDIDKLKSITEYHGCNENSPIIKRFWKMMTSFDDDQRQLYLKFAWGRSRLPIDLKNLRRKHTIDLCKHMDKTGFPQAHTCFFSIDLPDYPNEKIMRAKFLTAITMCGEIDTDGAAMTDFNGDNIRDNRRRGFGGGEE